MQRFRNETRSLPAEKIVNTQKNWNKKTPKTSRRRRILYENDKKQKKRKKKNRSAATNPQGN